MQVRSTISKGYLAIALLGLSLFGSSLSASTDDYLAAIKADVDEFFSKEFSPPADSPWVDPMSTSDTLGASGSEGLEGFSGFIQQKSPGSYIFYRKLPQEIQLKVYEEYLSTGNLELAKKRIFEQK